MSVGLRDFTHCRFVRRMAPLCAGRFYLPKYRDILPYAAVEAARFANYTASFAVGADGKLGIPTRAQVEERTAAADK